MSNRAIATATGSSEPTIRRVESGASNDAPREVTGVDGKIYTTKPRATTLPQSDLDALNEEAPPARSPR